MFIGQTLDQFTTERSYLDHGRGRMISPGGLVCVGRMGRLWGGHGVFQEAIRIASRQFEDATGKVSFEYTYATNDLNTSEVEQSRTTADGTPFSPGATRPKSMSFLCNTQSQRTS